MQYYHRRTYEPKGNITKLELKLNSCTCEFLCAFHEHSWWHLRITAEYNFHLMNSVQFQGSWFQPLPVQIQYPWLLSVCRYRPCQQVVQLQQWYLQPRMHLWSQFLPMPCNLQQRSCRSSQRLVYFPLWAAVRCHQYCLLLHQMVVTWT